MKIHLWGIRGSLPAPLTPFQVEERLVQTLHDFVQFQRNGGSSVQQFFDKIPPHRSGGYGGHTACVQVVTSQSHLIVDGGSGIRRLGEQLMSGPCGRGQGEVHILISHFHWDHLIGLPFFMPLFIPGNKIHFYAVQKDLEKHVTSIFQKPNFPVPFHQLAAKVHFHHLLPRQPRVFTDVTVTPYQLDHPDECWGFKFQNQQKIFSYCVDTECVRMSREELGLDLPLYQNVDVMIFDAQYSFLEAAERVNWGHASAPIGLDLAIREGVKKIYFVHHDPFASDSKIAKTESQTREYYDSLLRAAQARGEEIHPLLWEFAREGMILEV